MSLSFITHFLNDLVSNNININDTTEDDKNIQQGKKYIEYNRIFTSSGLKHLAPLQLTSSPALSSIIEAINGDDSIVSLNTSTKSQISKNEDEFNKTLVDYSTLYKSLSEEIMNKYQTQKDIKKYYGKVLTADDSNYVYVNDFGYTHRYSTDAWNKKDNSCQIELINVTKDELDKLNLAGSGPDMGLGQPCLIAGTNIKNSATGEVAWIDIKGFKHVYSSSVWDKKDSSCGSIIKTIDASAYDAIPSGNPMTDTSVCNKLDVNPVLWRQLMALNTKLVDLADKINKEISNLSVSDDKVKQTISMQQSRLGEYIKNLKDEKNKLGDFENIIGKEEHSSLILTSNKFNFLVWFILGLTLFSIAIYILTSSGDMIPNSIVLIVSLLAVYFGALWINKYIRYQ